MDKATISKLRTVFNDIGFVAQGIDLWYARDLQFVLGYNKWENFIKVIEKAKTAAIQSKVNIFDHFLDVRKKVDLGSGSVREIEDIALTRYACYLIAQNGDPEKEQIAFAQSYFAVQTRKQELIEERIALAERLSARKKLVASETELSKLIYERGVDDEGFARIRSKGDEALFGGNSTAQMKSKLHIPVNRPIADYLPTVTITAKNLATEITNFTVRKETLHGEVPITKEHVKNNINVRGLLVKSGIVPEQLPAEEDIKKLERRVKKEPEKLAKLSGKTKDK